MKIHPLVAAMVISLATVASAEAQRTPGARGRAAAAAEGDALGPAQVLNMLDAWAIVQAQDTLQLADDQYGEFVNRLKRLQQTRRRNLQARHEILQELRRLAGPQVAQVDENAIGDLARDASAADAFSAVRFGDRTARAL